MRYHSVSYNKALEQPECGHTPFLNATGPNIWLSPVLSWNIKLYRNGKLYSLLGWKLPKISSIPKKSSNKSFSASNFGQKSLQRHMSIFPWSGARGLENGWKKWMYFSVSVQFNISTISSFEHPTSRGGGQTCALTDFFVGNSMPKNFHLKLFSEYCVFSAAFSPKVNVFFCFHTI